ncbi:conserved Plasmodium protein, unknown function [Plasmodium gaboni]|uniref:Uncharacterized protein n=1 Tax=Plasmodium gaboni TaxID=647221 RepID=A0ABY1USM4_9APIC|nr:conserved Plasmodium protein, unknown function [Plasmodium gaboni]
MNELRELSKKIKENTTNSKKEEKKNDPEIKNLFENLFSNNSINYLSSFINKTNINEKPDENDNHNIREELSIENNKIENMGKVLFNNDDKFMKNLNKSTDSFNLNKQYFKRDHNNYSEEEYMKNKTQKNQIIKNGVYIKSKEFVPKRAEEILYDQNENIIGKIINVKGIFSNTKKNIETKDLNKLIDNYEEEIKKRSKNLEIFMNKNKNENNYNDKWDVINNFNVQMNSIGNNKNGCENELLYELYLNKKKKKKSYDSLVFFKRFFNCLNAYIYFLNKCEKNFNKLKIKKSLLYLRNCKDHILLIKAILKFVKNEDQNIKPDEQNNKNKNKNNNDNNDNNDNNNNNNIDNNNNNNNDKRFFDEVIMEDLRILLNIQTNSLCPNNNITFIKEMKNKYNELLNKLKGVVDIIYNKMFEFKNNNIKIYKYIYLHSNDTLTNADMKEQKICYNTFWYLAFILNIHVNYLNRIKKSIIPHFFKLMVIIYCIIKHIKQTHILNEISQIENVNSISYENIKEVVSKLINKKDNFDESIYYETMNDFDNFRQYIFCTDNKNIVEQEKIKTKDSHISNEENDSHNINLYNYICENEDSIFINLDHLFNDLILLINNNINIMNESNQLKNVGKEKFINDENKNKYNIYFVLSNCLINLTNLMELLFIFNNIDMSGFDMNIEKNVNSYDLTNIFNFYFDNENEEGVADQRYFYKYDDILIYEENINHIKDKLKGKYDDVIQRGTNEYISNHNYNNEKKDSANNKNVNIELSNNTFALYILNKELNENMFSFFHKINLKRNNLNDIYNVYYIYKWKQKHEHFNFLLKHIFKKNFNYYINYIYAILGDIFVYKNGDDYILIDDTVDNYLFNCFFDIYTFEIKNRNEAKYESILNYVDKIHGILKKNMQVRNEKNMQQKKNVKKRTTNKGEEIKMIIITNDDIKKNKKSNIHNNDDNDYNFSSYDEIEKNNNVDSKNNINIIVQPNKLGCIQIHRNLLHVVIFIYRIVSYSYDILFKMKHEEKNKGISNIKLQNNENKDIYFNEEQLMFTIHLNIILLSYKIIKCIYNIFLSYSLFIFRFCSLSNLKDEQVYLLSIINGCIFLKKILQNVNNIYMNYKDMFHFYIFFDDILLQPLTKLKSYFPNRHKNDNIDDNIKKENHSDNDMDDEYIYSDDDSHADMSISCDNNNDDDKYSISDNNYIFEDHNFKNKDINKPNNMDNSNNNNNNNSNNSNNSNDDAAKFGNPLNPKSFEENKSLGVEREEKKKKKKKKEIVYIKKKNFNNNNNNNILFIDKISILSKLHLFVDKININIDSFQNILIKLHKQNFSKLLNKDIILMEEIYLINTLEIINIIFEFFQMQDVYKLIHKSLLLRMMDYFFYLINKNIHNFIYEKKKINELERNHLYENFIFIQNKLSFVMINCIDDQFEENDDSVHEENYFLKHIDEMCLNLTNLKRSKIMFILLFCKVKHILNFKKIILDMLDKDLIDLYLSNNPYVYDDENYDTILNEFI